MPISTDDLLRVERLLPLSFKRIGEDLYVSLMDDAMGIKVRARIAPDDSVTVESFIMDANEARA